MELRTRALAVATVGAVALSTVVAVGPTATAAPNSYAYSAARWLEDQLVDDLAPSAYGPDYGLSIDVYFTLADLQSRPGAQARIIAALAASATSYVTGEDFGDIGSTYAGATGKLISAALSAGEDPQAFGGENLRTRLEAVVATDGDEAGRASDVSAWGDYSNTIGQSWVVRALAGLDHALVGSATAYLLKQQCASGQFRGNLYASDAVGATCDDGQGNVMSNDATAFGIEALLAAKEAGVTGLDDDITAAAEWLESAQAANGSVEDDGTANTNTTGLAATVLSKVGRSGAAGSAAAWIVKQQVTDAAAEDTKLANELGAIAYDPAALAAGKADGITDVNRGQWIRATAQAAAGVQAQLPATAVTVTKAGAFTAAGRAVTATATGLKAGEKYTASISGGTTVTGTVPASGKVTVVLKAPAGTATRTVTVTGSRANRSGSTSVTVLAKKKLRVTVTKAKVKRAKVQKVTIKGLAAKEPVRVRFRGKLVKRGVASESGTYVHRFKVGRKVGKAKVVVRGAYHNRVGTKVFKVVK